MSSNKYALVAWTENGKVRMVPSLVDDMAEYYRQRIARLESLDEEGKDEVEWLLAQSRAHEAFAKFFLYHGRLREAYIEFSKAAEVCTDCSDLLWIDGDDCCFPVLPLFNRFLTMHRECVRLTQRDKFLARCYEGSDLQKQYRFYTTDLREWEWEDEECYESLKAWRFGRTT